MLDRAISYRGAFANQKLFDKNFEWSPSDGDWSKITKICSILKPFYDITTLFSGVHYPTANLYFSNVWKIQSTLQVECNSMNYDISEMAAAMMKKFEKYWDCYSVILSMAVVLDPRYKLDFVEYCYENLHGHALSHKKCSALRQKMLILLEGYGVGETTSSCHNSMTEDKDNEADDFFKKFDSYGQSEILKNKSELDIFLHESRIDRKTSLDILMWWMQNECRYPKLASLAKDIMCIPITTVASESAFSMGGRVLSKWRSSLLPKNAEALITTRNWLYGFPGVDRDGLNVDVAKSNNNGAETSTDATGATLQNETSSPKSFII